MRGSAKFVIAVLVLGAVGGVLQARGHNEVFPPRLPLNTFPAQLGNWTGTDYPIEKEVLDVLGAGDFLLRVYSPQDGNQLPIDLFIAYFPSQRAGDTIHSPKNCLPGSGWTPIESTRVMLALPAHSPFPINRYIIAKGDSRELVIYWFWAHDRGVASEYSAKFYLVKDAITMNRSDGALVRITSAMSPKETAEAAEKRLLPFAGEMLPLLNSYIPR
ncbi:MAG TPA: EpsI family protein [Candidatus Sulfotelmatobacter sp.]|nr:EpsI family protein [Candidatus Sulfotelmatobacter sp.]